MINPKNKITIKPNSGDMIIDNGTPLIYNGIEFVNVSSPSNMPMSFKKGLEKYNLTEKELFEMLQKYHPEKLI